MSKNDYGFTLLIFIVNEKQPSASPSVAIECSLSTSPCHRCGATRMGAARGVSAVRTLFAVFCKLIGRNQGGLGDLPRCENPSRNGSGQRVGAVVQELATPLGEFTGTTLRATQSGAINPAVLSVTNE